MSSWVFELGATKVVPLPIDLKIGGQEHNLERRSVKHAILEVFELENTACSASSWDDPDECAAPLALH